jgi:uncharacterized membrane protein YgcG
MAYDDDILTNIRIRAVDETGDVLKGMSQQIESVVSAFKGLGVAEIARRAFTDFAEVTRSIEQVRFATKASDDQMKALTKTIDEVAGITGRSRDQLTQGFKEFAAATNQQIGPAMLEAYKTIAEASQITNATTESLSRTVAAAVNNMHVPMEQADELVKKWTVEIPASLEGLSQRAPQIFATLSNLGFDGLKNAEEIGNLASVMNTTFGNSRKAAGVMDELLNQMRSGETAFGKEMVITMQEVQARHGDINQVFESMFQKFDRIKDMPAVFKSKFGLTPEMEQGMRAMEEGFGRVIEQIKAGVDPTKAWHDELQRMKDPLAAIHELEAALGGLSETFGELLQSMGASDAIKTLIDQLQSMRRLAHDINEGEFGAAFKEAMRPVGGAIPGEGPEPPQQTREEFNKEMNEAHPVLGKIDKFFGFGPRKKMAVGGVVTQPTNALIGEDGPEAVVPLNKFGGGGSATPENTAATKDNTDAVNRLTDFMRNPRGGHRIAYTPGAGEKITPAEAGLYGGSGGDGGGSFSGGGGGGHFGGGGASGGWGGGDHDGDSSSDSTGPSTDNVPNGTLAEQRQRLAEEFKSNPGLRAKIMRIAANEQGRHPQGTQAVMESLFNRALVRGTSLEQAARWFRGERGGYYQMGSMGRGALENPASRAILERSLANTLAGSNIANYATDNSSGSLAASERATGKFRFRQGYTGETFFAPGSAEPGLAHKWDRWHANILRSEEAHGATPGPSDHIAHSDPSNNASFQQYLHMREQMEKPIRLNIEAPAAPPLFMHRQRTSRQEQIYRSENTLGRFRQAGNVDIGFS